MGDFKIKSFNELKKMPLGEVEKYYRLLRKYIYESNIPINCIEEKKDNYSFVCLLLQLDKLLSLRTVKVIGNNRVDNGVPRIYACTHIGRYDIESAIQSVREGTWFLMGDPGETYLNFDGKILDMHGVVYFDTDDKLDRHIALETCINILKNGGNILMFPEGAWNLDPLYPVNKLYNGVAEMAIRGNADIVPVGIEQYRNKFLKHYWVNIGNNLNFSGASIENKEKIAEIVRWKMADLKWEIWEKYGIVKRTIFPNSWYDAYNEFIDSIMCDTENGYTIDVIKKTTFLDKNKPSTPDEIFSYLNSINLNSNNAFLAKSINNYQQNNGKTLKKYR